MTTPKALSPTSVISTSLRLSKLATKRKNAGKLSTSDKIDKIVTNRWLGLPIFAVSNVPCLLHFNGNGRHARQPIGQTTDCSAMAGICSASAHPHITKLPTSYSNAMNAADAFVEFDTEAEDFDADKVLCRTRSMTSPRADERDRRR